jgi:hypothetical protein
VPTDASHVDEHVEASVVLCGRDEIHNRPLVAVVIEAAPKQETAL